MKNLYQNLLACFGLDTLDSESIKEYKAAAEEGDALAC